MKSSQPVWLTKAWISASICSIGGVGHGTTALLLYMMRLLWGGWVGPMREAADDHRFPKMFGTADPLALYRNARHSNCSYARCNWANVPIEVWYEEESGLKWGEEGGYMKSHPMESFGRGCKICSEGQGLCCSGDALRFRVWKLWITFILKLLMTFVNIV